MSLSLGPSVSRVLLFYLLFFTIFNEIVARICSIEFAARFIVTELSIKVDTKLEG